MSEETTARAADPRPARTRAAICAALTTLTEDGHDVTVNSVTRAAGVSRSAFYTQFSGLEDLAIAVLIDEFREIGIDDLTARASATPENAARTAVQRFVRHIFGRRAFYRATLGWSRSARVERLIIDACAQQVLASLTALGSRVPAGVVQDDAALFIAGGTVTVVTAWLQYENGTTEDDLVERLLAVLPWWLVDED